MQTQIDVPAELGFCVTEVGGRLLDDDHGPNDSKKADYWFPEWSVVGELKCLSDNYFDDLSYSDWLDRQCEDWVRRGLIPKQAGRITFNLACLPTVCADEVTSFLRRKLDGSLKLASSQIQNSRRQLGADSALGLLILVNDGNFALPPGMVRNIVARSLPHKHSGIDSIIHLSANMPGSLQGMDEDLLFWLDWNVKKIRPSVPGELIENLRVAWRSRHSALLGTSIGTIYGSVSDIYNLKIRKS